jgi:CYTH domain-containing protein
MRVVPLFNYERNRKEIFGYGQLLAIPGQGDAVSSGLSDHRQTPRTVRVRIVGNRGFLTVKGLTKGIERTEYEYEIPVEDARSILTELCEKPVIEKKRCRIEYKGLIWEVDEFFGENKGLVLAEVELTREDRTFEKPEWVGKEVSADHRYQNANLVKHPYASWK